MEPAIRGHTKAGEGRNMNGFFMAVVRAARWICIGTVILLLALAAGLLIAPDLIREILRWTLIALAILGAVCILWVYLRSHHPKT